MRKDKLFFLVNTILIVFILLSTLSFAQKSPKDEFDFPKLNDIKMPKVIEKELPNGIKLYLVEDHTYPTINMRGMVRAGSVYEPADKVGLAYVTGAVLRTGGTESMTGDEIDKKLETMAASIETGIGETSGYISVSLLKDNLVDVLPILADILMNPVFDEEKIELEKVQQRSAISRRNDNVSQITNREFYKVIYGEDSPYARHTEYETINAITRDDIVKFYSRFFHPNNIMMTVWGDFNAKDMVKKLEKTFAGWKPAKLDIPPLPEVKYDFEYTVNYIHKPDVNQANIMMGHIGGIKKNPDLAALTIMNSILSFDRMFKKIRTDEGLAYSVWGSYGTNFNYKGVFNAGAQTKSQSTVYAIQLMIEEMKHMMNEEVTAEELKRAKDQYLNSFVFNFDSKSKIVNRMLTYAYYDYPIDFAEQLKQDVEKVTREDVLRVAKKYLRPDQVQILVVGNKEDFDEPLSTLGSVNEIDITIPQPKEEAPEATAESLEEGMSLLKKSLAALGGVEKLKQVTNFQLMMEATQVTPMGEMTMDGTMSVVLPDKVNMTLNTPQGEITMIINTDKGMMKSPTGSMPMPPQQRESILSNVKHDPIYIAQNLDKFDVQFVGKTTFGENPALDLLVREGEDTYHLYLNPETYYLLGLSSQEMTQQGPGRVDQFYSDYKNFGGIQFSTKSVVMVGDKKQSESNVKDIKLNVDFEDALFTVE